MGLSLTKPGIDLGIVITDSERSLYFYRDLLGLEHVADTPFPLGSGGTMHRLQINDTLLKLVKLTDNPDQVTPGGPLPFSGLRYFTIAVSNLEEMAAELSGAGVKLPVPVTKIRDGVSILMAEDPDGNWVELIEYS